MLADLEQQAVSARQQWRVQSARPDEGAPARPPRGGRAARARPPPDHADRPGRPLDDLMPIALTNRPEIASRRALVEAAEVGVRREKARPFIPIVALNGFQTPCEMLQAGIFGIGPNSSLNQWTGPRRLQRPAPLAAPESRVRQPRA